MAAAQPAAAATPAVTPAAAIPAPASRPLTAGITGIWKSDFESQIGHQYYTFTFQQDGARLAGKANSQIEERKREAELKDGKVEGDAVSFVELLDFEGNEIRITYTGKLSADGNEIKFTREVGEFVKEEIVARREPGTSAAGGPAAQVIRIKAGRSEPVTDAEGNVWLADQGFEGGQTIERPTSRLPTPRVRPVPGGALQHGFLHVAGAQRNYTVKLHFAETYEGITGPGERVFSFNVQGREFKDFDVWVKAGGFLKAYVETVPVTVTDGKIKITFTPNVQNRRSARSRSFPRRGPGPQPRRPPPRLRWSLPPLPPSRRDQRC